MKFLCLFLATGAAFCTAPPRVGDIEFYGLHKLSEQKLLRAVHLKAGDPIPPSKGNLEDALEKVSGVVLARVEAVCCDAGKTTLFIGIEEKGAPHLAFHSQPPGDEVLPEEMADTYHKFLDAVRAAARRGSTAEDLTAGHSLMADPDARDLQYRFGDFATAHVPLLRQVLRDSEDDEQRAIAATIIGYAPHKKDVINDLEYAMQDPSEAVRANALRALNAIAVLARLQPQLEIRVSPTWFVEMLNSIVLGDRTHAATALVTLTDQNPAEALDEIRDRALDSVVEMAQWRALRYALPPFILVGRLAGMKDADIQKAWTSGDRETVIKKALSVERKKKPSMGPRELPG
ncbi:MAG TPA: HEAT repeat domain-containing protein [Bryobacteraceae bacterium]|nr:HEAT repeat domain-containing protein [Bryobacteraceae bacterium]